MKKIIVTGSEGLIGTEICKYFEKNNNVWYHKTLSKLSSMKDGKYICFFNTTKDIFFL